MVTVISASKSSPATMSILDASTKSSVPEVTFSDPDIPGVVIPEEAITPELINTRNYVGYKIEKQKYDEKTGEWTHLSNIYVDNLLEDFLYDTQLSYNQYYRYRAYTIVRVIKDGSVKNNQEYNDLITRIVELAPETADILKIYGTSYNAYWIESYPSSWKYIKIVDKRPPPPPEDFQIYVRSDVPAIWCVWAKPINLQKDIVQYKVYRRDYGSLAWYMVFQGGTLENLFVDTDVQPNKKYVYAVQCIDIHGLHSVLSSQWVAEINQNFSDELEEKDIKLYQGKGETIERDEDGSFTTPNLVLSNEGLSNEIIAYNRFLIIPNAHFPSFDRDFIIKITSLDTDEKHEILLHLKKEVVPPLEEAAGDRRAHPSTQAKAL